MVRLEVCANSIESCIAAQEGGAHRIELCAALGEGGITPSAGMLAGAVKAVDIPIFPIIRTRGGDFLYSDVEVEQMLTDIRYLRKLGAHGFVVGALTADGRLNHEVCKALISEAKGLPVTLHRAFDMTVDLSQSLEEAIELGFSRILTSGGKFSAIDGTHIIRKLVRQACDRIIIMAGSGVRIENAKKIISETGVEELHGSFQSIYSSKMLFKNTDISLGGNIEDEYSYSMTDSEKVKAIANIL